MYLIILHTQPMLSNHHPKNGQKWPFQRSAKCWNQNDYVLKRHYCSGSLGPKFYS